MPFAEFQPASPALALPQLQLQSQESAQRVAQSAQMFPVQLGGAKLSLMERAQALQQSADLFPIHKEALAANLAMSQQELKQKQLDYRVAETMHSVDMTVKQADTQRAQLDAEAATAHATLQSQQLTSQLLTTLPGEVDKLFHAISAPAESGDLYSSYRNTVNAVNAFKARYGGFIAGSNSQGLHDLLGRVQLVEANANASFQSHVLSSMPELQTRVARATTTAELSQLESDPVFSVASTLNPGLKEAVKIKVDTLKQAEETIRNKAAEKQQQIDKETREGTVKVPGYSGVILNSGAKEKFETRWVETQNVDDNAKALLAIADKVGNSPVAKLDPATRGEAQAAALALSGALKGPLFGGRLTNTDIALLDKVAADPTHFTVLSGQVKAALKKLVDLNQKDIDRTATSLGLQKSTTSKDPATPTKAGRDLFK